MAVFAFVPDFPISESSEPRANRTAFPNYEQRTSCRTFGISFSVLAPLLTATTSTLFWKRVEAPNRLSGQHPSAKLAPLHVPHGKPALILVS